MNALNPTAFGIASAVLGRPRAAQRVHVCRSTFDGTPGGRHVVLVTPLGQKFGDYFECYSRGLSALEAGMTPEELGLECLDENWASGATS